MIKIRMLTAPFFALGILLLFSPFAKATEIEDSQVIDTARSFVERQSPNSSEQEKAIYESVSELLSEIGELPTGALGTELIGSLTEIRDRQ